MSFYAIAKGKNIGIFNSWNECKSNTDGYRGAIFKKFYTKEEAEKFILDNTGIVMSNNKTNEVEPSNAFHILMKPKHKQTISLIFFLTLACPKYSSKPE